MTPFSPAELLRGISPARRPYLTFYGGADGNERVELSGHVLAQWVAKAANFLAEEDVGAGDLVVVDLPVHWRAVVWTWAAWVRGASVSFVPDDGAPAVVATDRPERHAARTDGALVVAVPLAPLALRWDGELPGGVVDGAAAVMGQADVLLFPVPLVVADRALEDSGLSFEDLDAAFGVGDGSRIAFLPGSVWELVRTAVSAWLGGGSVVVFGDEVTLDRRTALCEQEGANLR